MTPDPLDAYVAQHLVLGGWLVDGADAVSVAQMLDWSCPPQSRARTQHDDTQDPA